MKSKHQNSSDNRQQATTPQHQSLPNGPITVVCVPPTLSSEQQAEKKKKKRRKTIAFWVEIITAVILAGYFGVTILIWWANNKSATAAKKSADTAQDALVIGQRPWAGTEREPSVTLKENNLGWIDAQAAVAIKNFGQSPALNIGYHMMPLGYEGIVNDIQSTQEQFCQRAELEPALSKENPKLKYTGFSIFPNGTYTVFSPLPSMIPPNHRVAVLGCLAYVDQFHKTAVNSPIHHTRFCFWSAQIASQLLSPKEPSRIGNDTNVRLFECNLGNGAD
jgi:hypothetical protein